MSTAATLIAKGKAEGIAEGRAECEARGKLTVLQKLMRLPISSEQELDRLDVAELERRFKELELQYEEQFKRL